MGKKKNIAKTNISFQMAKQGIYARFFKRGIDLILSLAALVILSPILLILMICGTVAMKGNPFFVQERPGKNEKIFKLIKFRTMTSQKDAEGNLLPDEKRLTAYGNFLRSTSLDELPELFNIFTGKLAICGPRPLLTDYLDQYDERQRHRHDVRPGLTGYAQIHGRNALSWEERFDLDLWYVNHITFLTDLKIVLQTIRIVLKREGISSETSVTMEKFQGNKRRSEEQGKKEAEGEREDGHE